MRRDAGADREDTSMSLSRPVETVTTVQRRYHRKRIGVSSDAVQPLMAPTFAMANFNLTFTSVQPSGVS